MQVIPVITLVPIILSLSVATAFQAEFQHIYLQTISDHEELRKADCDELNEWVCQCVRKTLPVRLKNPSERDLVAGEKAYVKYLRKGKSEDDAAQLATEEVVALIQKDIRERCRRPVFATGKGR